MFLKYRACFDTIVLLIILKILFLQEEVESKLQSTISYVILRLKVCATEVKSDK